MTLPEQLAREALICHVCDTGEANYAHKNVCRTKYRPAVEDAIRKAIEACAEVGLRRVAPDSSDHVAANCHECHDGLMVVRDIRALLTDDETP